MLRVVLTLLVLFAPASSWAHKVVASAWADGAEIEGEIGFSNGDMAPEGTVVKVFGPDDVKVGETATDAEGLFRFAPAGPFAHTFRANLGAGHAVEFTLAAEDLPSGMTAVNPGTVSAVPPAAVSGSGASTDPALAALVAEAVRREVKPLRKELTAYKEKNDLQTILGGIGYIFGIFGLWFFIAAKRRK